MFSVKRNQVIISALVVMIAVAGYLNYIDRNNKNNTELMSLTEDGEITALVLDDITGQEVAVVDTMANPNNNIADANVLEGEIGISVSSSGGTESVGNSGSATEAGTAVFVNSSNDSSYFLQAKLSREQARSNQRELLTDIINNANVEKEKKSESAEALLTIQGRIEKETAAEALIESKGFSEVYVRIDDDTVDVVVNKSVLSDAEIAQIEDIVKRKTGYSVEQIHINPLKY